MKEEKDDDNRNDGQEEQEKEQQYYYSPELQDLLSKLRPFQKEAFEYVTRKTNGKILIADEMGLGKTITSLSIMLYYKKYWPLLIICPSSLKYIWPNEIEKFIPTLTSNSIYIIDGFNDIDFFNAKTGKIKNHIQILICTLPLLQQRCAAMNVLLDNIPFECIIIDESHNLKDKNTQRSQYAMNIIKNNKQLRSLLLLSGTPALSKPCELWVQLSCIAPDEFGGTWSNFIHRYCNAHRTRFGYDYNGLSNADELHTKMNKIMIRRLKCDVLKDLPTKQRMAVPVSIKNNTNIEYINNCKDIMEQIERAKNDVHNYLNQESSTSTLTPTSNYSNIRTLISQAYQYTGIAKAQSISEYVIDYISGCTTKIIIFAHHKIVLDIIESNIQKYYKKNVCHIRIDGTTSSELRCKYVETFQNTKSSNIRIALLSMTAAGVGLTLTAASSVIFAELYWTPGILVQAEDRVHRIGQKSSCVNIMYCICKDESLSIDNIIWRIIGRRFGALKRVVDGSKGSQCVFANKEITATIIENNNNNSMNNTIGKESEEDELASFFATNDPSTSNVQKKKKIPSKGSIQSFFTLTNNTKKQTKKNNCDTNKEEIRDWSCLACTFQNKYNRNTCEMCHTPKQKKQQIDDNNITATRNENIETIRVKTPLKSTTTTKITMNPNSKRNNVISLSPRKLTKVSNQTINSNCWLCLTCTFQNKHDSNMCKMCNTSKEAKEQQLKMKNDSTITLSDDNETNIQLITPNKSTTSTSITTTTINSHVNKQNNIISPSPNQFTKSMHKINTTIPSSLSSSSSSSSSSSVSSRNSFDSNCFVLKDSCLYDDSSSSSSNNELDDAMNDINNNIGDIYDGNNDDNNIDHSNNRPLDLTDCFVLHDSDESIDHHDDSNTIHSDKMDSFMKEDNDDDHDHSNKPIDLTDSLDDDSDNDDDLLNNATIDCNEMNSNAKDNDEFNSNYFILKNNSLSSSSSFSESQDERDMVTKNNSTKTNTSKSNTQNILSFDISKNTGRIFLYYNYSEEQFTSLNINFDINDILSSETSNKSTELIIPTSRMKRILSQDFVNERQNLVSNIVLNDDNVHQLLDSINWNQISHSSESSNDKIMHQMKQEIQLFVSTYLALNQIEKKMLQNVNTPTTACNVRQVVSQAMLQSSSTTNTAASNENNNTRYANGAMEKAILSRTTNTTTPIDRAVLNHQCCAWCANPLPKSCLQTQDIIYCSQKCASEARLKRSGKKIRSSVFALEQGKCRKCGIDAHSLFLRINSLKEPCERMNVLCNANWRLPLGRIAYDRFLRSPKESDFWQVDHIIPVAEGGGACGIENFRTLCTPCHKIETDRLHQRLKVKCNNNNTTTTVAGLDSKKQMDIRNAFGAFSRDSKRSKIS